MSKKQKRLAKIRQNPKNVTLSELKQVLADFGFELKRINGSHHIFELTLASETLRLTIPLNKPIKVVYIDQFLQMIEQIEALTANHESEDEEDND